MVNYPAGYFERAFYYGRIQVNDQPIGGCYRLRKNDRLTHTTHIHEPLVSSEPIQLLHVLEDLVVVNKPAGIPIYSCSTFRNNCVIEILKLERNFSPLFPVHRIDRNVSGLLLLARKKEIAQKLCAQFYDREIEKNYICLVDGNFPSSTEEFKSRKETTKKQMKHITDCSLVLGHALKSIFSFAHSGETKQMVKGISLNINVGMSDFRTGKGKAGSETTLSKEAETDFFVLGFLNASENKTRLLCQPKHGRKHQIRVHLQYLGFPIVNDILYNHKYRKTFSYHGVSYPKIPFTAQLQLQVSPSSFSQSSQRTSPSLQVCKKLIQPFSQSSPQLSTKQCFVQERPFPQAQENQYSIAAQMTDPGVCPVCREEDKIRDCREDYICLHSFCYSGPGWCYCNTTLPHWFWEFEQTLEYNSEQAQAL